MYITQTPAAEGSWTQTWPLGVLQVLTPSQPWWQHMSVDPAAAENNWGILSFLDNAILNFLMKHNGMKVSYII